MEILKNRGSRLNALFYTKINLQQCPLNRMLLNPASFFRATLRRVRQFYCTHIINNKFHFFLKKNRSLMQAINWIILLEEIKNLNTDTYKKIKNEK